MEDNGFTSSTYTIMNSFPNRTDLSNINIWPTITVEIDNFYGRPVELGAKPWGTIQFFVDVLAKSKGQKEDISYLIYNGINEEYITYYDFNIDFPERVADYSPAAVLGQLYVDQVSIANVEPDPSSNIVGEQNHAIISGIINLPN